MAIVESVKVNTSAYVRVDIVQRGVTESALHSYGYGALRSHIDTLRLLHCDVCDAIDCDTCRLVSNMLGVITAVTDARHLAISERING